MDLVSKKSKNFQIEDVENFESEYKEPIQIAKEIIKNPNNYDTTEKMKKLDDKLKVGKGNVEILRKRLNSILNKIEELLNSNEVTIRVSGKIAYHILNCVTKLLEILSSNKATMIVGGVFVFVGLVSLVEFVLTGCIVVHGTSYGAGFLLDYSLGSCIFTGGLALLQILSSGAAKKLKNLVDVFYQIANRNFDDPKIKMLTENDF
eukprot:TRINITY_DN17800_c0_g1_i1.p1 TRINITY_DN17800_c0_g1~~TRINITY_DN17800_c0_g1_i1.p1  ORF type:complete len:205 (+),score=44.24 TRINITY_DN17800_c0_g1_i1:1-615(+)